MIYAYAARFDVTKNSGHFAMQHEPVAAGYIVAVTATAIRTPMIPVLGVQ
jgi:hypothetical protein